MTTSSSLSTNNDFAIGIDLGTTYSCVAVFRDGRVEIIDNDCGQRTTPSYVAFTDDDRLVGEAAKNHLAEDPTNTVYDVKRLIGRRWTDEAVQQDIEQWPFKVVEAAGAMPKIEVNYKGQAKRCSPEEISAMVLCKMKQIAEDFLEQPVTKAVITVPAYFNDAQRQATIDAGRIAGLQVLRIINEPTAAGYCYGMDKMGKGKRNVLIFDLGGGTFDVTILSIDDGKFTVKSTGGNCHLGGEDFDNLLANHCVEKFKEKHGRDLSTDKRAYQIIRSRCEKAKITLSSSSQTTIKLDYLFESVQFSLTITRAFFEQLCERLFRSTLKTVSRVLSDAKLGKSQIDDIVLVGGSTRIPKVQQLLQEYFNRKELRRSVNPDLAVACGAAIQAAILNQNDCEAIRNLKLCDVTPLSLGVRVVGGRMVTVVQRNTPIPAKKQQILFTSADNQTRCSFKVYEGERALTRDNNFLGEFEIEDIPPAPLGVEKFICTFEINVNGILSVNAVNQSTGKHNEITITNNGRMSNEEVEKKITEAELFQKNDEDIRQRIMAKENLERYVHVVKCNLKQNTYQDISKRNYDRLMEQLEEAQNLLQREEISVAELFDDQRVQLERICHTLPI